MTFAAAMEIQQPSAIGCHAPRSPKLSEIAAQAGLFGRQHEIYAVAAKDSTNFVRTSAIPISIAVAANGNKDGSLVIESRWQAAQVGYVGVAILMVIAALLLLIRLVRRPRVITGTLPELVMPDSPGKS